MEQQFVSLFKLEDIKNVVQDVVRAELQRNEKPAIKLDEYLTIEETAKYLKVSAVTLWKWSKGDNLTKHYINGLPRYKKSEVDEKFVQLNSRRA